MSYRRLLTAVILLAGFNLSCAFAAAENTWAE